MTIKEFKTKLIRKIIWEWNHRGDALFRLNSRFHRFLISHSKDPRPSSYPYISGDTFRKLAKFVYDDNLKNVIPEEVKEGDIIFIGNSNTENFLKKVHPKIKNKYVIISHNGDAPVDDRTISKAEDKVIKWYGINVTTNNSRVIPIPLGIENKHYYVKGIPLIFNRIRKKSILKKNKIFYGFTPTTNLEERNPALDALQRNKYTETVKKWVNFKKYLNLLATYKFVASPPGSSVEGHRTWDALYIDIIPIVKSSITTEYFKKIGVPFWVLNNWHELDDVDGDALDKKFKEIRADLNKEVLFMDYWVDKIKNLKD